MAVLEASGTTPRGADIVISTTSFQMTEYEQVGIDGQLFTLPAEVRLRLYYQSGPMGLRDASRLAAALSYARGTYVSVVPKEPRKEKYREWWFAGAMWDAANVPPVLSEIVMGVQRKTKPKAEANQSRWLPFEVNQPAPRQLQQKFAFLQ